MNYLTQHLLVKVSSKTQTIFIKFMVLNVAFTLINVFYMRKSYSKTSIFKLDMRVFFIVWKIEILYCTYICRQVKLLWRKYIDRKLLEFELCFEGQQIKNYSHPKRTNTIYRKRDFLNLFCVPTFSWNIGKIEKYYRKCDDENIFYDELKKHKRKYLLYTFRFLKEFPQNRSERRLTK